MAGILKQQGDLDTPNEGQINTALPFCFNSPIHVIYGSNYMNS